MPVDVSAPLPQLDLSPNSIVTVTLDDAGATITRLVLHGWQDTGPVTSSLSPVTGAYLEGDGA